MAIREDLVSSAVTFLQDPSVANSPLDKKLSFLQSKNLTQEEIDVALSRAAEFGATSSSQPPVQGGYGYQQQMGRPPASQYAYNNPYGAQYWQQPPPEVPRRDWRDYFIMATVMSGVSYGLYFIAKRYIVPLIAPPTPPQLEQDKTAIDEAFNRAFALIEQLSKDTAEIKSAEEARKEKLDTALAEVEIAVSEMKASARKRDDENRRIGDEVKALQDMIPKAMKTQEESNDARLKELNTELKSLKTLISNRISGTGTPVQKPTSVNGTIGTQGSYSTNNNSSGSVNGNVTATDTNITTSASTTVTDAGAGITPDRSENSSPRLPYGRTSGRGGIPAWQMAASKKAENEAQKATSESGTVTDADTST